MYRFWETTKCLFIGVKCVTDHQVGLREEREQYFFDESHCKVTDFQEDLQKLSEGIKMRNKTLKIPYTYMDPAQMEKSVAL